MQGTEGSNSNVSLYQVLFENAPLSEASAGGKYTYQVGDLRAVSLAVSLMTFRSGVESHRVVLIQDVSVFEELEKEKMYLQYQKTFFTMITHELRNPLHGIMGVIEVLKGADLPAETLGLCTLGLNTGKLMMCLVNDILDISQMEANKFKLNNEMFSPLEAAHECVDVMQCRYEEKKVELRLLRPDRVPKAILADKMRFKQIIFNLLGNSLKFTDRGFVEVNLRYDPDYRHLTTSVTDTGTGLTQEEQAKLFQMYTRIESHNRINPQGTAPTILLGVGLGLMICKKLSEAMGGSIRCESEKNKGTRFTFDIQDASPVSMSCSIDDLSGDEQIPNEKPAAENISGKILHPDKSPAHARLLSLDSPIAEKAHVLVVDDEFMCGKVTKAMIEACNVTATLVRAEFQD
jgi:signal transduction histidine kinase